MSDLCPLSSALCPRPFLPCPVSGQLSPNVIARRRLGLISRSSRGFIISTCQKSGWPECRLGVECAQSRLIYCRCSVVRHNSANCNMNLPASRVLLVEDDPRMPEVLGALLQDDNITLGSAKSASLALKLAREEHYDLILLDLGLPDVNGFDLLRQLKETPETQSIPVIVLTAWNS